MNRTLLITGGTGFLGTHIREALLGMPELGQDCRIVCMSRRPEGRSHRDPRVSFVRGDVRDAASIEAVTRDVDIVVHCVQFPNHPVEKPSKGYTYLEIDAKGTERVAAAAKLNGVRRIVYLSGAGTSEDRPESWFRAKVIAERAIRETGLEYVILRPSWVYGPEDRSLNKFVAFIRYLPVVPVIGNGKSRVQPVSVEDVARVAALAAVTDAGVNRTFELGGPTELSMDEILECVMKVMGKRRLLLHHPAWLMKIAALPMSVLPSPPLSPAAIDFILQETHVDPVPAEAAFGLKFRALEDGLAYLANR